MATNYEEILKGKYPAKAHAKHVVEQLRLKNPDASGVIYLEGRATKMLEDSDAAEPFRQRRPFFYITGCPLPDCYVIYDIDNHHTTLFIPPIDADDVIWSGLPVSPEQALELYDVDEVKFTTDINAELARLGKSTPSRPKTTVYAIPEQVSDHVSFLEFDDKRLDALRTAIEDARAVKSDYEVALIRKANEVSSAAHRAVMARARTARNETELEAVFKGTCIALGAKKQAYDAIVASGRTAATLHYGRNDADMAGRLNLLLDAGAEWDCYAADITRTFPISGAFSKESREIYDVVLRMQLESIARCREGAVWDDIHADAHRLAIDGLLRLGILRGDEREIFDRRVSVAFFPHGLGHMLGMDTHDTGGHPDYADKDTMFRYLRIRGKLPAGAVVTVEPGIAEKIYFCEFIIKPYLEDPELSKYIDVDVLNKYWDVGGVRIEDNILIKPGGYENLTPAVKDVAEMEKIISSG
ncbi:uncharacterized protein E0L32_006928 [Thyridium curvatum]|uniref:Xaa-Pro aminopeptidase n=1 Tax=Thyridium curvatum TaxID=1093900 RepID=A0A507B5F6_9PEZI|nr:uncharacterized protein E0L32_006928 [Thyridium curvatum]TPX12281.1 hypothetical protein E0L32_006928 [Thyridium curvatum]